MPTFTEFDRRCMARALHLARRGEGFVEPNPMVGCVIAREGKVLGEGYHRRFGGPHGEIEALQSVQGAPRNATAYVTLEPCCHYGKTPPCTKALIEAGIRRVVVGVVDAGPNVNGGGVSELRKAGIRVEMGLLEEQAAALLLPYHTLTTRGRPFVTLKWAQSLDGKLATSAGHSKWITGPEARRDAHKLRARVDAIVVGVGTVLADDPSLNARDVRIRRTAARVVVDTHLRTPPTAALLAPDLPGPVFLFTTTSTLRRHPRRAARLESAGARIVTVPATKARPSLKAMLATFGKEAWTNVMVEGGPTLLSEFLHQGLADSLQVYLSPRFLGERGRALSLVERGSRILDSPPLPYCDVRRFGDDVRLRIRLVFSDGSSASILRQTGIAQFHRAPPPGSP